MEMDVFSAEIEVTIPPERRESEFEKERRFSFSSTSVNEVIGYNALVKMVEKQGMTKAEIGAMLEALSQAVKRHGGIKAVQGQIARHGRGQFWLMVLPGRPRRGWRPE